MRDSSLAEILLTACKAVVDSKAASGMGISCFAASLQYVLTCWHTVSSS